MHSRAIARLVTSLVLAAAMLMTGCATPPIEFVDEGNSYSIEEVTGVLSTVEPSPSVVDSDDPAALRTAALGRLRRSGGTGNDAASLITSAFPADTRGVPFYVERAAVDGESAWIVVEAIGPVGRELTDKRLWVLDDDGEVLFSATR